MRGVERNKYYGEVIEINGDRLEPLFQEGKTSSEACSKIIFEDQRHNIGDAQGCSRGSIGCSRLNDHVGIQDNNDEDSDNKGGAYTCVSPKREGH